jgi:hypothetical protein
MFTLKPLVWSYMHTHLSPRGAVSTPPCPSSCVLLFGPSWRLPESLPMTAFCRAEGSLRTVPDPASSDACTPDTGNSGSEHNLTLRFAHPPQSLAELEQKLPSNGN